MTESLDISTEPAGAEPAFAAADSDPAPAPAPAPAPSVPTAPGATAAPPLDAAAVGERLKQLFPALFTGPVKPLKLRIQVDLQQRAPGVFSRAGLSAFFRRHTGSTAYLMAVAKAPQRVDLDGQPAGEIAEEHRQAARDELARRRTNRASRDQLLEQQRQNRAALLRDFERTTLSRPNFCTLKGVEEAELDGLIELARREAAERREAPAAFGRPSSERPGRPRRPGGGGPARR